MRIWPEKTVDQEFADLAAAGHFGSLNDRQFSYLRGQGLTGGLADMMSKWRAAPTVPAAATASFGAKTIAGAGAWRPLNSANNPVDLTSYDSLVSGSLGSYTPSISSGGLRFTGAAGAPNGAVLRCSHAGGQIDITISTEANAYSCATLTEASAAYADAVLGDTIRLRAGEYNTTAVRTLINRASAPSGTWTGTAALSDGNWVVLTRDTAAPVTVGAIEVGSSGGTHNRYLRIHDLDFVSPFNADGNGLGTGVSAVCNAQVHTGVPPGGYVAVTNCRFRHVSTVTGSTTGAFRAIMSGTGSTYGPFWIEGNTINGARHGIIGSHMGSVIRGNTMKRILSDCAQIGHCDGMIFEGNLFTDKIYGHTPVAVTGVTRGATTVITMADTSAATVNEAFTFSGFSGAFGSAVNGQTDIILSKTATTVTVNFNSSALPDWDGVSGTALLASGLHGDYLQFNENLGATPTQINVTIRGNVFYRGFTDGVPMFDGQGIFGGGTGTTANRDNWLVEGNIIVGVAANGITVSHLTNGIIRSNTVVRQLGVDGTSGGSDPQIAIGSTCSGMVLRDNIANAYSIIGGTTSEETNNVTITITNEEAVPADPANVATYEAAFVAPVTTANINYDPITAFATRTDGGSVYPGPIYPGATPYMDFETLVYDDPRFATVPDAMDAPTSAARSRSTALTITKAADPADGGSAITSYDLRHSPDGSTWTEVIGFTSPYELTGLTPGQNYHIQTRAVNAVGAGAWSASVQDKTSLVDFTATPTLSGGTASAITDGWELSFTGTGNRQAAWNFDGLIAAGATGTFSFTIETSSTADAISARMSSSSLLGSIRGLNQTLSGLVAGVPQDFSLTSSTLGLDSDWLGIFHTSTTNKTIRLTNLKLVTP